MSPNELRAHRPHFPFNSSDGRYEVYELLGENRLRTAWFQLAACPFCDGLAMSVIELLFPPEDTRQGLYHVVACPDCGSRGPWARTEVEAIQFWNIWNKTPHRQLTEWQHETVIRSENDQPF